jgi:hypothetical protein
MCIVCGTRDSTIISKSLVNLMYGHQTRSNKTKTNVYCGARDFTIGKSYVSLFNG